MLSSVDERLRQDIPAAISDIGCERDINEDRCEMIDCPSGRAWIVCDGMGGSMGGDLAAQLAIDAIRRGLLSRQFENATEALRISIEEANRIIVLRRQNPAFSSMGTTVVAAMKTGRQLVIAHAGDSRAYCIHEGTARQLTIDHTYVQDLVDRGSISADEALSHPDAHVLTRCVGYSPRLDMETQVLYVWDSENGSASDKILLCSDGLYSLISDEEISTIVSNHSPQESCEKLVDLARARGGYDNITVTIFPAGGVLRDENPGGDLDEPAPRRQSRAKLDFQPLVLDISAGKKVGIMFFLFLFGAVAAVLGFVLKLIRM